MAKVRKTIILLIALLAILPAVTDIFPPILVYGETNVGKGYVIATHGTFYDQRFFLFYINDSTWIYAGSVDGINWQKSNLFTSNRRTAAVFVGPPYIYWVWWYESGGYNYISFRKDTYDATTGAITLGSGVTLENVGTYGAPTLGLGESATGVIWTIYKYKISSLRVKYSTDGGATWSAYTDIYLSGGDWNTRPYIEPQGAKGEMYAVYAGRDVILYGRRWDGTAWGTAETIGTPYDTYQFSAVADRSYNVHIVWIDSATRNVLYNVRTNIGLSDVVIVDEGNANREPGIVYDGESNSIFIFWISGDTVFFKARNLATGEWSGTGIVTGGLDTPRNLETSRKAIGDTISIAWIQGTSSPYDIVHQKVGTVPAVLKFLKSDGSGYANIKFDLEYADGTSTRNHYTNASGIAPILTSNGSLTIRRIRTSSGILLADNVSITIAGSKVYTIQLKVANVELKMDDVVNPRDRVTPQMIVTGDSNIDLINLRLNVTTGGRAYLSGYFNLTKGDVKTVDVSFDAPLHIGRYEVIHQLEDKAGNVYRRSVMTLSVEGIEIELTQLFYPMETAIERTWFDLNSSCRIRIGAFVYAYSKTIIPNAWFVLDFGNGTKLVQQAGSNGWYELTFAWSNVPKIYTIKVYALNDSGLNGITFKAVNRTKEVRVDTIYIKRFGLIGIEEGDELVDIGTKVTYWIDARYKLDDSPFASSHGAILLKGNIAMEYCSRSKTWNYTVKPDTAKEMSFSIMRIYEDHGLKLENPPIPRKVIWTGMKVKSLETSARWADVGADVNVVAKFVWAHDDSPMRGALVEIEGALQAITDEEGKVSFTIKKDSPISVVFKARGIRAPSDVTYRVNELGKEVIWTKVRFSLFGGGMVNTGDVLTFTVRATYAHDNSPVIGAKMRIAGGEVVTDNSGLAFVKISRDSPSVIDVRASLIEDPHGITLYDSDSITAIWTEKVLSLVKIENTAENATIYLRAAWAHDGSPIKDLTIYLPEFGASIKTDEFGIGKLTISFSETEFCGKLKASSSVKEGIWKEKPLVIRMSQLRVDKLALSGDQRNLELFVRIIDERDMPIGGVKVYVKVGEYMRDAITNEEGNATIKISGIALVGDFKVHIKGEYTGTDVIADPDRIKTVLSDEARVEIKPPILPESVVSGQTLNLSYRVSNPARFIDLSSFYVNTTVQDKVLYSKPVHLLPANETLDLIYPVLIDLRPGNYTLKIVAFYRASPPIVLGSVGVDLHVIKPKEVEVKVEEAPSAPNYGRLAFILGAIILPIGIALAFTSYINAYRTRRRALISKSSS